MIVPIGLVLVLFGLVTAYCAWCRRSEEPTE
jgi:hypothetical protein